MSNGPNHEWDLDDPTTWGKQAQREPSPEPQPDPEPEQSHPGAKTGPETSPPPPTSAHPTPPPEADPTDPPDPTDFDPCPTGYGAVGPEAPASSDASPAAEPQPAGETADSDNPQPDDSSISSDDTDDDSQPDDLPPEVAGDALDAAHRMETAAQTLEREIADAVSYLDWLAEARKTAKATISDYSGRRARLLALTGKIYMSLREGADPLADEVTREAIEAALEREEQGQREQEARRAQEQAGQQEGQPGQSGQPEGHHDRPTPPGALAHAAPKRGRGRPPKAAAAAPATHQAPPGIDPGQAADLSVLRISAGRLEKLREETLPGGRRVATVADLEALINQGRLQQVKGIGLAAVDAITDALVAWRAQHPVPHPQEPEEGPEQPQGRPEGIEQAGKGPGETEPTPDAQRQASPQAAAPTLPPPPAEYDPDERSAWIFGATAARNSEKLVSNPHRAGTRLWRCWDSGWQEMSYQIDQG